MAHLTLREGTYEAARARLGKRDHLTIGHNTSLERFDGVIAVRLHSTNVLTFTADGWTIIRANGWETSTTSDRVNALLPPGWRIGGDGKGQRGDGWGLYRTGPYGWAGWARIATFIDGLAVRQDPEDRSVGMAGRRPWQNETAIMLDPDQVESIVITAEGERAAREAKRAARLAREHAKGVAGDYGMTERYSTAEQGMIRVIRYHPRTYGGRQYDCLACQALRS